VCSECCEQVTRVQQSSARQQAQLGYSVGRSPSQASLKDSADGVLKDLETGLKQSTNYIQESRGPPAGAFDLEHEVQHMIGGGENVQQQQQQQQLTTYKVQSNQYSAAGERLGGGEEERPGSRLKQNIDELDTLLYDLNNARNLSPESAADYGGGSSLGRSVGLDSDDYDETLASQGHVKRTVSAFNEYSAQAASPQPSSKPPSPSPRRKPAPSPGPARKLVPAGPGGRTASTGHQTSQQSSQQFQSYTSGVTYTERSSPVSPTPAPAPVSPTPDPAPAYYAKYASAKPVDPPAVSFPAVQPARSPTPQSPPKRVEELMSEFREFDRSSPGGSPGRGSPAPAPASFATPSSARLEPAVRAPVVEPAPVPAPAGPEVYYPPGMEFTPPAPAQPGPDQADSEAPVWETAGRRGKRDRERAEAEAGDKQGAAVIPICLPLCCAAPCVIM